MRVQRNHKVEEIHRVEVEFLAECRVWRQRPGIDLGRHAVRLPDAGGAAVDSGMMECETASGLPTTLRRVKPQKAAIAAIASNEPRNRYERASVKEARPIHQRDPLFREIFRHTDQIEAQYERTPKGVRVVETSRDPYVVKLIQAHAQVVSAFIANGRSELMKNHPVP
jgi:hypothetical protein